MNGIQAQAMRFAAAGLIAAAGGGYVAGATFGRPKNPDHNPIPGLTPTVGVLGAGAAVVFPAVAGYQVYRAFPGLGKGGAAAVGAATTAALLGVAAVATISTYQATKAHHASGTS